ncbi:Uncharacterized protein FWK35_00026800, partial [Aphis craccivora]
MLCFSKAPEKPNKKLRKKREFLRKTSFRPNRFFYMVIIQKLITVNTCNFHQMFMSTTNIFDSYENFFWKCRLKKFWMSEKT